MSSFTTLMSSRRDKGPSKLVSRKDIGINWELLEEGV